MSLPVSKFDHRIIGKMKSKLFLIAAVLSFGQVAVPSPVPQTSAAQSRPVSVDDVVAMKQAGLSDEIVIAKIQQHNTAAELSTDDLVRLKKEKISDNVIKILLNPQMASTPSSTTLDKLTNNNPSGATPLIGQSAMGDPNDPLSPHDSGIYLYTQSADGKPKMILLERTAYQGAKTGGMFASAMTYGIAKVKTKAVIPGNRAEMRVAQGKLTFYFYFEDKQAGLGRGGVFGGRVSNPSQFALIRLNVEKNARTTEIGKFSMWGGSTGTNDKAVVGFKVEKVAAGLYKVETNESLKAGEYCFLSSSGVSAGAYGAGATMANDLFDFGTD